MYKEINYKLDNTIAVITLQSKSPNNKLNHRNIQELIEAFKQSVMDKARVIMLTGSNGIFCGGGTIGDFTVMSGPEIYEFGQLLQDMVFTMKTLPIPIVGVINGNADGGGFSLMEACDLCITSPDVSFSIPEINGGFCPAVALVSVEHGLGVTIAKKMAMTGDSISAKKAFELGFIIDIVHKEDVMDKAVLECQKIVCGNPTAYRVTKEIAFSLSEVELRKKFSLATGKLVEFLTSNDAKEALISGNESRVGIYTNR